MVDWCFTKPRNYLQISTEIFILTGGYPSASDLDDRGLRPGLSYSGSLSAEEQPQIFRLRFTPLKMTTMFLFRGSEGR